MARITGRRPKTASRRAALRVEALEGRQLMAIDLTQTVVPFGPVPRWQPSLASAALAAPPPGNSTGTATPMTGTVRFVGSDAKTQGTWTGTYGGDGSAVADGQVSIPSYATVSLYNARGKVWASRTTDVRALQSGPGSTSRVAAAWTGSAFAFDVNLTDGKSHIVSFYATDFARQGLVEDIEAVDPTTGNVLDDRTLSSFSGGDYLTWTVSGHVQFWVVSDTWSNAVVGGLFFGGASTTPPTPPPPPTRPPTPPPAPPVPPPPSGALTPTLIDQAYGFNQLGSDAQGKKLDGTGQTIAIVDAYADPTISTDLAAFDKAFNLPAASLVVRTPGGTPTTDSGWDMEIALDVEWAHAIAPGATILLEEAKSSSFNDLLAAVDDAVAQGAKQVSMSWGGNEFSGQSGYDSHFDHPGVTFTSSSGDSGSGVSYPAISPYVTAVGGTTLNLNASGNRTSETGWSGSGGGISTVQGAVSYQSGFVAGSHRSVPDVSYDADPNTGFAVYDNGSWTQVGGTSAGAPQWAGLIALVNQGRADAAKSSVGTGTTFGTNQSLYALAGGSSYTNAKGDFYDVTSGSNGRYSAKAGYDQVTGLGSPVANKLVKDLINS